MTDKEKEYLLSLPTSKVLEIFETKTPSEIIEINSELIDYLNKQKNSPSSEPGEKF